MIKKYLFIAYIVKIKIKNNLSCIKYFHWYHIISLTLNDSLFILLYQLIQSCVINLYDIRLIPKKVGSSQQSMIVILNAMPLINMIWQES